MSLRVEIHTLGLAEDGGGMLADISDIAMDCTLRVRHNMPRSFEIRDVPAGDSRLTDVADDGIVALHRGDRKLIAWEDDEVIFHGRVWIVERTGDGTTNTVAITAFDPWMELGSEADDRAGRPVRDDTGNFITPDFGTDPVSGPSLVKAVLENSVGTDDEGGAHPGEGPLPINVDVANFTTAMPPNVDLNPTGIMSWPMQVGDFLTDLVNTGVVDIHMRPVDPSEGFDPFTMVDIECGPDLGTDRSEDVHFDYWTGSHNAMECRHVEDFSTINNKLYDFLGPPLFGGERFPAGNITPSAPGVGDSWPLDFTDAIDDSRERYGVFMQIRIVDTDSEDPLADANRPLFVVGYAAEQGYRVEPRDLLFITPAPLPGALYDAPSDFDVGDLITVNVGSDFGLALAEPQRVYGYDKTWTRERVAQLSQLLTSADPA